MEATFADVEAFVKLALSNTSHHEQSTIVTVVLSAPACAGKTTFATRLCEDVENATLISAAEFVDLEAYCQRINQRLVDTFQTQRLVVFDDAQLLDYKPVTARCLDSILCSTDTPVRCCLLLTRQLEKLPRRLSRHETVMRQFHLKTPKAADRRLCVLDALARAPLGPLCDSTQLDVEWIVSRTTGMYVGQIYRMCAAAMQAALHACKTRHRRQPQPMSSSSDRDAKGPVDVSGFILGKHDIETALRHLPNAWTTQNSLFEPSLPSTRGWQDFAGHGIIKARLTAVATCLQTAAEQAAGDQRIAPPKGLLIRGPVGVGKTHLAHCFAAEVALPFFHIQTSQLFSKYFGETEQNIRRLFADARAIRPSIILIDDIDAIAARRGQRLSSSGVSERTLAQLLNEMDGIESSDGLLVIGCTSKPLSALEPAILRPGRLEIMIELPFPNESDRHAMASFYLAKFDVTGSDLVLQTLATVVAQRTSLATPAYVGTLCRQIALTVHRNNIDLNLHDSSTAASCAADLVAKAQQTVGF